MNAAYDKDHLDGFRDEATMFDVDTKARREPLPMTSMSGIFEPVLHLTMVCKNSENKSVSLLIIGILRGEWKRNEYTPIQNIINPASCVPVFSCTVI